MKITQKVLAVLALSCAVSNTAWTTITFGSRDAGFVVSAGTLTLTDATITDGSVRSTGGTVDGDGITATSMTLETKDGTTIGHLVTDGAVALTSATISLSSNQKLSVNGGIVAQTVTAAGTADTPSVIEGFGGFAADISLTAAKEVSMRFASPLNRNISAAGDAAKVTLERDLAFIPGKAITAGTNTDAVTVDFGGYRLLLGGDETTATTITHPQTWENANLYLTGPLTIAASKTVTLDASGAYIDGAGNKLIFNSGSVLTNGGAAVTVENTVLSGVTSASLAGTGAWTLINTTIEDANNAVVVNGSITSSTVDVFGGDTTFGASHIDLIKDVTLSGTWTFDDNALVDGRGCHLDLASGVLKIADNKTLSLRNITLDNVASASLFDNTGYTGTLELSDVTIILGGANVTWTGTVVVNGPLMTIMNASYVFTGSDMTLNGVTAYYDTLSTTDNTNLVVSSVNTGRILFVNTSYASSGTVTIAADADLSRNEYLYPTDGAISGRVISCTADATYDGHGRSLVFPYSDGLTTKTVLSVADTKTLITTNMVLEGLVPDDHIDLNASGALYFGDDTTIRLSQDIALAQTLQFGTSSSTTDEVMVLDLAGHTVDMSDASALISVQGATTGGTVGNILRIKNGRLINLSGSKLAAGAYKKIILENVELELLNNYTFANALITIEGHCVISGVSAKSFIYTSTAAFTIATGASLTVMDGMILHHNNAGSDNFVFADGTATLDLMGGTFKYTGGGATLTLSTGRLVVDHKSTLSATTGDTITLDTTLDLQIRPAASVLVSGAGTVTTAAVA